MESVRTTGELLAAGLSAGRIRRLVRDGDLCPLRQGVYASAATVTSLARAPRDPKARRAGEELLRLAAVLAVSGSGAAVSHGSADFLWRRYRTIGEADGAFKYETPDRARAQLDREARLRAAGYEVVHFSWPEITRVPAQVVDSIRVAFRRGGPPG